jgi:hypothetical protein
MSEWSAPAPLSVVRRIEASNPSPSGLQAGFHREAGFGCACAQSPDRRTESVSEGASGGHDLTQAPRQGTIDR